MYEFDLTKWNSEESFGASNTQKFKLLLFVSTVLSSIYIPLIFINYQSGYTLLAALDLAFVLSLFVGSLKVWLSRTGLPNYILFVVLTLLALSATTPILFIGVMGTFWCFPIVISSAFLISQRASVALNISVIVLCGGYGFFSITAGELSRLIFSLIASASLAHVFAYRVRKMQALLKHHSTTDPLTGALNRRELEGMLLDSIAHAKRFSRPSVIAIFDLDDFKKINDGLGHAAGDQAIIELVNAIGNNSRSADLVFRLGGDEILLLLRDVSPGDAQLVLNSVREKVASSKLIPTTASIGASGITGGSGTTFDEPKQWIESADKALYKAKQQGKNQVIMAT